MYNYTKFLFLTKKRFKKLKFQLFFFLSFFLSLVKLFFVFFFKKLLFFYVLWNFFLFFCQKNNENSKKVWKRKKAEFSISLISFFVKKLNFVAFYEIWHFKHQKDEKLVRFWQVLGKKQLLSCFLDVMGKIQKAKIMFFKIFIMLAVRAGWTRANLLNSLASRRFHM